MIFKTYKITLEGRILFKGPKKKARQYAKEMDLNDFCKALLYVGNNKSPYSLLYYNWD